MNFLGRGSALPEMHPALAANAMQSSPKSLRRILSVGNPLLSRCTIDPGKPPDIHLDSVVTRTFTRRLPQWRRDTQSLPVHVPVAGYLTAHLTPSRRSTTGHRLSQITNGTRTFYSIITSAVTSIRSIDRENVHSERSRRKADRFAIRSIVVRSRSRSRDSHPNESVKAHY